MKENTMDVFSQYMSIGTEFNSQKEFMEGHSYD